MNLPLLQLKDTLVPENSGLPKWSYWHRCTFLLHNIQPANKERNFLLTWDCRIPSEYTVQRVHTEHSNNVWCYWKIVSMHPTMTPVYSSLLTTPRLVSTHITTLAQVCTWLTVPTMICTYPSLPFGVCLRSTVGQYVPSNGTSVPSQYTFNNNPTYVYSLFADPIQPAEGGKGLSTLDHGSYLFPPQTMDLTHWTMDLSPRFPFLLWTGSNARVKRCQ